MDKNLNNTEEPDKKGNSLKKTMKTSMKKQEKTQSKNK